MGHVAGSRDKAKTQPDSITVFHSSMYLCKNLFPMFGTRDCKNTPYSVKLSMEKHLPALHVHICGLYLISSFPTFHWHIREKCQASSLIIRCILAFGAFGRIITFLALKYSSLRNTILGGNKLRCKLVSFKSHHFHHTNPLSWHSQTGNGSFSPVSSEGR